jgi:hypothetical protein
MHSMIPMLTLCPGSTTRLHGRLSVYYNTEEATPEPNAAGKQAEEEEDSDEDSDYDRDDETVSGDGGMGDLIYDLEKWKWKWLPRTSQLTLEALSS